MTRYPGRGLEPAALDAARKAANLTRERDPAILDTLAAAYHAVGDTQSALVEQERAVRYERIAAGSHLDEYRSRLETYRRALHGGPGRASLPGGHAAVGRPGR